MIPSGVSYVRRAFAVIGLLGCGVAAANPEPWQLNLTPGVTPISQRIYELHMLGFYVCVGIGILVFGAMFVAMFRFRKSKGAVAEQWSHSTKLEAVWTVAPIVLLVVLAWPATKLLIDMANTENADMTIKITGYQWKWRYEYVDYAKKNTGVNFISSLDQESNRTRQLGSGLDPNKVMDGGYKSYRRATLEALDTLPKTLNYIALVGPTGSGKTRLLSALHEAGAQTLDLEALAAHRGSLLGAWAGVPQPSQKRFDTLLVSALREFDPGRPPVAARRNAVAAVALRLRIVLTGKARPAAIPGQLPEVVRHSDAPGIEHCAEEPDRTPAGFAVDHVGAVVGLAEAKARPGQPRETEVAIEEGHHRDERARFAVRAADTVQVEALMHQRAQPCGRNRVRDDREVLQPGDDIDPRERRPLQQRRIIAQRLIPKHNHGAASPRGCASDTLATLRQS